MTQTTNNQLPIPNAVQALMFEKLPHTGPPGIDTAWCSRRDVRLLLTDLLTLHASARQQDQQRIKDMGTRLSFVLAQLRHAYQNLVTPEHANGTILLWTMKERTSFADGLLSPQIKKLEELRALLVPKA